MATTAYLHINGIDYKLAPYYGEAHSQQLQIVQRQARELVAGGPGMITVQVVLGDSVVDLVVAAENVVTAAVFLIAEEEGRVLA